MTRRSVVRAGAAAAWAVPMVQIAAAAPSFAASGPANLSTSSVGTASRNKKDVTIPNVVVVNSNNQSTTALTVTVASSGSLAGTQPAAPTGWSAARSGNSVVFTRQSQLAGNSSTTPATFLLTLQNNQATTLTITASPGATGTPKAFSSVTV
ncbi:hypothetical protein GON03_09520 [Nocardioides sp. MAH-18]|uniref:Uncharacterized protein n=1 Tax=Nocardioides agri TaxID=2682843 RepID=A0A6L6XQK5_9ACTN|nr:MULTISPECIES: hypothetical protein [unclassified Nocardioides]MBA2954561.1 hypothetical protein [Nocardioides sp. CGMCC 1.13656]MVQ49420.1 hypothetical protein [Nocardioides sp. MAH-18]